MIARRTHSRVAFASDPQLLGAETADAEQLLRELPEQDNTPSALKALLEANQKLRRLEWPPPYGRTTHTLRLGDARQLDGVSDQSVHLVVTSPPYWTLNDCN